VWVCQELLYKVCFIFMFINIYNSMKKQGRWSGTKEGSCES